MCDDRESAPRGAFLLVPMVRLAATILFSLLSGPIAAHPVGDTLGPLTIFRDPDSPLLVVRELSAPPLLAIRLSIPYDEPRDLAGAGRVLQLLVQDRVRGEVERFGGKVEFRRTPTHLVYSVRGPALAFGDMIAVLRYAVAPPRGVFQAEKGVWLTARREALAAYETPDRLVRHRLERALFPDLSRDHGDLTATEMPGPEDLEWFWRRWFQPSAMSVVVVGAIAPEAVRAAFHGWPEPPPAGPRRSRTVTATTAPGPEIIAPRVALGYRAGAADPAALALAAALVDGSLRQLRLRNATSEFWWLPDRTALVVLATADADLGRDASRILTDLQICVSDAARASAEEIERQRRRLVHTLVMRARTPAGLAALVGEFLDRTGDPRGADRFLRSLAGIDDEEVRGTLRNLLYQPPTVVELRP